MPKIYLEGLYKDFAIDPTFWRAYADWEPQSSVGSPKTVFLTPPSGGGQNPRFGGFGRSATTKIAKVGHSWSLRVSTGRSTMFVSTQKSYVVAHAT